MLKVKDTVVHPGYGICKVIAVKKEKEKDMYVLKPKRHIPGNFRILIPKKNLETSGVRHPIRKSEIGDILKILESEPDDISEDSEKGYPLTKAKIQNNNLYMIAEAIRDLKKQKRYFSIKDELLQAARQTLAEEIAYVKGVAKNEADKFVDNALKVKRVNTQNRVMAK